LDAAEDLGREGCDVLTRRGLFGAVLGGFIFPKLPMRIIGATAPRTVIAPLAPLQSLLYKKKALDQLQKKFVFHQWERGVVIGSPSGKTVQFYRYKNGA
jgi:hypothetical protein